MLNHEGSQFTPEAQQLLNQLSIAEQRRIAVVLNGIKTDPALDEEQIEVFLGGKLKKGAITHHILVAVRTPDTSVLPVLSQIAQSLDNAGLRYEMEQITHSIGQPYFLPKHSQSLGSNNGKPMHITVGKIDHRYRNEIKTKLV